MEKKLLLGDEAIALGAIHAGLSGVYTRIIAYHESFHNDKQK